MDTFVHAGQQSARGGRVSRTRASAKAAGASFERLVADYLADQVDDRIDRRVKTGRADKGDIGGVRLRGHRIVLECKNHARMDLPGWYAEAETECAHDDALLGAVVHKRRGTARPERQWVTMSLGDFARLVREANT